MVEVDLSQTEVETLADCYEYLPNEFKRNLDKDSFKNRLFSYNTEITKIILNNHISRIPSEACYDCKNLESITLSSNIKYIGDNTFENCINLKEVKGLTNAIQLKEIGYKCFVNCSNLSKIDLPISISCIRNNAFKNCSNLIEINLPINITQIDDNAFENCINLKEINIPNIQNIGSGAFKNCSNLTNVVIPRYIKDRPDIFYKCNKLINKPPNEIKLNIKKNESKDKYNITDCYEFYNDVFGDFRIPAVDKQFQFIEKRDIYNKYMENKNIGDDTTEFNDDIIKNLTINDVISEDETYNYLINYQKKINTKLENGELKEEYKDIFKKLFSSGFVLFNLQNCRIQNLFNLCCFLVNNYEKLDLKFNENPIYNFINSCEKIEIDNFLFKYVEFHLKFHYLIHKFIPRKYRGTHEKNNKVLASEHGYNGLNVKFELFKTIITDIFNKDSCIIDDQKNLKSYDIYSPRKTIISMFSRYEEYYDAYGHTMYLCRVRGKGKRCYIFDDLTTVIVNIQEFNNLFENSCICVDNILLSDDLTDKSYTFFKSSKICNYLYLDIDEYAEVVSNSTKANISYKQCVEDDFNKIKSKMKDYFYPLNIQFKGGNENDKDWLKYVLIGLIIILVVVFIIKLLIKFKIFNENENENMNVN